MIHTWFECRVSYEKTLENGMTRKVTEPYLVDALSFMEAESRIVEEMTPFISGEFSVAAVKKVKYSELFTLGDGHDDKWYKAKLGFVTLDERSGQEKKTYTNVLVQGSDLRRAIEVLDVCMKGSMADYVIVSVAETPIMDICPYEAEPDVKPEFKE